MPEPVGDALILAEHDQTYQDLAVKFFEHFAYIASAMYEQGLWDEEDGFYYDVLHLSGQDRLPHPFEVQVGAMTSRVDYEPGESTSGLFGGNSNWRGPIWFPVNYLAIEALRVFYRCLGDEFTVEMPTGSGRKATLDEVARELSWRLVGLFLDDSDERRPVFGSYEKFQRDPAWHDMIPFHEYFHGDTGAGLGASHQTGWTGLVADLILRHSRLTEEA